MWATRPTGHGPPSAEHGGGLDPWECATLPNPAALGARSKPNGGRWEKRGGEQEKRGLAAPALQPIWLKTQLWVTQPVVATSTKAAPGVWSRGTGALLPALPPGLSLNVSKCAHSLEQSLPARPGHHQLQTRGRTCPGPEDLGLPSSLWGPSPASSPVEPQGFHWTGSGSPLLPLSDTLYSGHLSWQSHCQPLWWVPHGGILWTQPWMPNPALLAILPTRPRHAQGPARVSSCPPSSSWPEQGGLVLEAFRQAPTPALTVDLGAPG